MTIRELQGFLMLKNGECMQEEFDSTIDLSHLTPATQITAMLSNTERIDKIRSERWISYTYALQALRELEDLFNWPSRQRMPNMLLIGATNNGKSMIIEKFCRQHLSTSSEDGSKQIIPIVNIQMPSNPAINRFYMAILYAMNAPIPRGARVPELEILSLQLMKATQVRMLIIDELHNLLSGGQSTRHEFLNLLRFLGNELRIPVIGVGTDDAYRAIRSDAQLENRFKPFILPRWQDNDELATLLASFLTCVPLRKASTLHSQEMMRYILSRTEGTIGEISTLLTSAAVVAIETGEEAINSRTLALVSHDNPTERRQKFERQTLK